VNKIVKKYIDDNPTPVDVKEQTIAMIKNYRDGDVSHNACVESLMKMHSKLMAKVIKRSSNVPSGDIMTIYYESICYVIKSYDITRTDWKFPTYTLNCMTWKIIDYLGKQSLVYVPRNRKEDHIFSFEEFNDYNECKEEEETFPPLWECIYTYESHTEVGPDLQFKIDIFKRHCNGNSIRLLAKHLNIPKKEIRLILDEVEETLTNFYHEYPELKRPL